MIARRKIENYFLYFLYFLVILCVHTVESNTNGFISNLSGKIPQKAVKTFFPGGQYVLLTFSGGPHFDITPQILSILSNYSIRATFFVSGQRAMHHPELTTRIVKEKHDLGHQGFYTNVQLNSKTKEEISQHVSAVQSLLMNLTNHNVNYFRPPGNVISDVVHDWVQNEKTVKTILWSIDLSEMFKGHDISEKQIKEKFMTQTKPGDIINCYDHKLTIKILPTIIEALIAAKYEFITVTDAYTFPDDSPH